ncbi:MAG: DHHW family protein [Lachnospiraceae bacterium]|nr:DHHW family protein [Lachnospiraceae bacterium]
MLEKSEVKRIPGSSKNSIKNTLEYKMTLFFTLFILGVFVLYFLMPDNEKSEWENRYLEQAPKLSVTDLLDGTYMTKYEDYINDQIPFRDGFIKVKAVAEAGLLKCENNGIVKGKDSYLFTKGKDDTTVFDKNIDIIDQFAKSVDSRVTVAIAPNASGVLEDKVPKGFMMPNQAEKLDALYADKTLLKDARVVDLKSVLRAREDEYIYYRTDHHWTTNGAYYAYQEISENPIDLSAISENVKAMEAGDFLGTLYAKYKGLFVNSDIITYYDIPVLKYSADGKEYAGLLDTDKLSAFDKYGMFMRGNFGRCDVKTSTKNGKSLIIFKDSYANCLIPFLTYDYEDIIVLDLRYAKESIKELVSDHKDSDILFLYNFDFLNEDNHFYKLMK